MVAGIREGFVTVGVNVPIFRSIVYTHAHTEEIWIMQYIKLLTWQFRSHSERANGQFMIDSESNTGHVLPNTHLFWAVDTELLQNDGFTRKLLIVFTFLL